MTPYSFFKVGNLLMFGMEPDHPLKFLLVSVWDFWLSALNNPQTLLNVLLLLYPFRKSRVLQYHLSQLEL